jgi:LexA-binding, inner membrane-associated putative hydrolase
MNPITHTLLGWTLAQAVPLTRRDRVLVTLAGLIPDVDGLGMVAEVFTRKSAHPLLWWSEYHHVLGHNLGAALVVATAVVFLAHRRWACVALAWISFHVHLVGDLMGARGPDGYQWPIPYLLPFSDVWQWTVVWGNCAGNSKRIETRYDQSLNHLNRGVNDAIRPGCLCHRGYFPYPTDCPTTLALAPRPNNTCRAQTDSSQARTSTVWRVYSQAGVRAL